MQQKTREELCEEAKLLGLDLDYLPEVAIENIFVDGEKAWQESMKEGIGSSSAAAAVGKSKYKTAAEIALEKMFGKSLPISDDPDTQYRLNSGHMQEVPLLKWYAARLGYVVALSDPRNPSTSDIKDVSDITQKEWDEWAGFGVVCVDHARYRHPKYPFMFTDMDGICFTPSREKYVLECKTADAADYDWNWKGGIWPEASVGNLGYIDQARQHMAVSNTLRCDIIASCGFNAAKNVVITVYRDMNEEKKLIETEKKLWEAKEDGTIPSFTTLTKRSYENVVHIIAPEELKPEPIRLSEGCRDVVREILSLQESIENDKKVIDEKEERINALHVQILMQMDGHTFASMPADEPEKEVVFEFKSKKTTTFNRKKYELEHPEEAASYLKTDYSEPKLYVKVRKMKKG